MKRLLLLSFLVLFVPLRTFGQEPPYAEDLQFVRELRSRGYIDLAREYLDKLAKNASAALKKELPLERALTEMKAANYEPDSNKRIALYAQARQEFQQFLRVNPTHPRAADTKLDIARATSLQGKTQLSRAMLEDDPAIRTAEGAKARAILVAAFDQLKQLQKSPETDLEMAQNLIDQSNTYLNAGNDTETQESGKRILEARQILDQLGKGDQSSKITWIARAWAGRCLEMLDNPTEAISKLLAVTSVTGPAVQDGKRLARYFLLLARKKLPKETPDPKDSLNNYLIKQAQDWLRDYPRYLSDPEGLGVQYLLAELLLQETENTKKDAGTRERYAASARRYLSNIDRAENEFTDRAKRLKIRAMDKQGTFKKPIDRLLTFEDCFVRAQYEQMQIAEDAKRSKDNKTQAEEGRKNRIKNILAALQAALKKADAKTPALDVNNARTLLTFYLLEQDKPKEAIEVGEAFARSDKRASSQAAAAAIYALVAYGQLLGKRERDAADPKALKSDPEYKSEKEHMLSLAQFMAQRWPKERAGDLARHEIALHLLRDEKEPEAIEELAAITPAYPSYIRTQFLLARAALQMSAQDADKGDPKGYKKRALAALRALPDPAAGADIETNAEYIQARLLLALELVKSKQFKEVDKILAALAPKLASLKIDNDPNKETEKRRKFEDGLVQLSLHSSALQANSDFKAAKYKEVAKRLDTVVDKFNSNELPQLRDSGLGPSVIALDLRANVQLNNMARARTAIKALQALQTDKGDSTTAILAQLVNLITQQVEELRKKGDKDSLKKARAGFAMILNEVAGGQKKPTPKLAYLLARCYAGMEEHNKAVELLQKFAAEGNGTDVQLHHAIQLLLVQEHRQLKEIDKARELLDEIIKGKNGKPGWGAKNLDAQKLRIQLLEDREDYVNAARLCDSYVNQLVRRLDDNKLKEHYFEFYYHLVYCIAKHGQRQDNAGKKAKTIRDAAQRLVALEKKQGGFGGEESKKRFEELLEKETDLREQYNALKGSK